MAKHMESAGLNDADRKLAGQIEAFFSSTSREHHAEEEAKVFPALLASGNTELATAVRTLQQDHGWIEENWLELAPRRWQQALQPWFLLPLVLPSVLWVVGLYSLALHTRLEEIGRAHV